MEMIKRRVQKKSAPSFAVEFDRADDGRWIAEIPKLPGVMAYGATKQLAQRRVYAIALRTLADKAEKGLKVKLNFSTICLSHGVASC